VKRLLFGPRRRTPLEPVVVPVLAGAPEGVVCGVDPALADASVDCEAAAAVAAGAEVDFAAEEDSVAAGFGGSDGGGTGVALAALLFPDAGPLLFLASFRFPFPDVCFSGG
jgi:hypothetical protein